jgi:integrase
MSETDADMRHGSASVRRSGWPYMRTDDVRRIPLPISLANEMAAYNRDVGASHGSSQLFLVKEDGEGHVVPITRGEIERIIATATAASPSPATLRRFPATFCALHVAAGLDDYIAWLVCDRFGGAHRTRAYYTCISPLLVGRALKQAARKVRNQVRAVAEDLGLRPPPALDPPRAHRKDRALPITTRRVVLPSIGSPFRLRDDAIRALVTYLYARLTGVRFTETLRTPEGHNLATVYLVLCLALLTALRPFEVDDIMADLCFVESADEDIGSLIPCPLIMVEAKANRHHEEDRLIPLFGMARQMVEQALTLPLRTLAQTLPVPLRGRLFYLIEPDESGQLTARLPTASALMEALKRTLQDDNLVHLVEELRLYDMRHVLRSRLAELLYDPQRLRAFAGDQAHVIDLIMGHHEDGGWLDPLMWPRSVGKGWIGDANRMAADRLYDDIAASWQIKALPPLSRTNPRGQTTRRILSTTERADRLAGDRADLRMWLNGVARGIGQGRDHAFADLSIATRKRMAARLAEEGARLVVPYLTPRGIDALATRVVHDTVRGFPRRLRTGTALARVLSRACGLPLPTAQAVAGVKRQRMTDAVRLTLLRDYPLWAVDALRRAISTTFPTSLLLSGAGLDRTVAGYALALLLLVEGFVLPAAGLGAIVSPNTVVTLEEDGLLVRPHGHGAALPPWRVPAATLAYTVAVGLFVQGRTERTLPRSHGTIRLLPEGTSTAAFDTWLVDVCARVGIPPIPPATLTEWCRLAALWATPALSLGALAGSPLYATSIPDSNVVRDAWRQGYPDDSDISASDRVTLEQPLPEQAPQRRPSMACVMEVPPALQAIRDSLRHLRNDTGDRVAVAEQCLARVAAHLGIPPPSQDSDAWGAAAVMALQGAAMTDAERNTLILDLWLGVQAARRTRRALAKGTLVRYGYTLVRFVNSLGAVPLCDATTLDVVDFLDRGDATRTRQTNFVAVCALLDLPGLKGCPAIDRNDEELHLAIERWPMPTLLPQHVDRFLAADIPLRDKAMGIVGLMGLRSGEVRRLSLRDIDLRGDAYIVVWRSKRGTTRRIPLRVFPAHWRVVVAQFVEEQRQVGGGLDAPLFATTAGRRYDRSEHMTKPIVARLTEISGLALRFHDLRGSCANYLLSHRYDARFIALILGHATVLSTLWYTHILDQDTPPARPLKVLHPYLSATEVATLTRLSPTAIRSLLKEAGADMWSPGQLHKAVTQAGGHVPLAQRGRAAERYRIEDVCGLLYRLYVVPVDIRVCEKSV